MRATVTQWLAGRVMLAAGLLACCPAGALAKQPVPVYNEGKPDPPSGLVAKVVQAVTPRLKAIPDLHGPWENADPQKQSVWRVHGSLSATAEALGYGHPRSSWRVELPTWKAVGERPNQSWAPVKPTPCMLSRGKLWIRLSLGSNVTWSQTLQDLASRRDTMNRRTTLKTVMATLGKAPDCKATPVTFRRETRLTELKILGCPAALLTTTTTGKPSIAGYARVGARRTQLDERADRSKESPIELHVRYDGFRQPFCIALTGHNNAGKQLTVDLLGKIAEMLLAEVLEKRYPPGSWQANYVGVEMDGAEIPQRGTRNATLLSQRKTEHELYGDRVRAGAWSFVRGRASQFGGPDDQGVTPTETGALAPNEVLRKLNTPLGADRATISRRPGDFYYIAMRWNYSPRPKQWWARQRLVVVNPRTGAAVVVRPVDWGPDIKTKRAMDLSPQAMRDLALTTDQEAQAAFVKADTPLGPSRNLDAK